MATAAGGETKDDDELQTSNTRGENNPPAGFLYIMNSHVREFIFVLAVVFTAIAALQNSTLKTRKVNPPVLFFTEPSLITDFYRGELQKLASLTLEKDVSLVMYYAPWDAKSMYARQEFETVAKFYHHEVFFAAINCWWPEGECGRKYKIAAYPVLIAHVHGIGAVQYRSAHVATYVITFLDNVLSPIVNLQSTGELLDLLAKHEGVLVLFFDFESSIQPMGFDSYFSASLNALSRDPFRKLCFAVITNRRVRMKFKMKSAINLYLWNETKIYEEKLLKPSEIVNWAYSKLDKVSQWASPPGVKSNLLSEAIEKSATLIMFTPRNLMMELTPYYDLLREMALDYNNCDISTQVTALIHRIILRRHILQEELSNLVKRCQSDTIDEEKDECGEFRHCDLTCCQMVPYVLGQQHLVECSCKACLHYDSATKINATECQTDLEKVIDDFDIALLDVYDQCNMVETSYPVELEPYDSLSFKCHNKKEKTILRTIERAPDVEITSEIKDDRILSMVQSLEKLHCSRLKFAYNYSEVYFPDFPLLLNTKWKTNFTGLRCQTNRTLLFYTMDSVQYHAFAESLGVDVLSKRHQTVAVIVEAKQENLYLMEEAINKKSLVEFVKNYSQGSVDRYLRSAVHKLDGCKDQEGSICVQELTTYTFGSFVLDKETDVVLMYYAPWCGACAAVYHVFLGIAHYFAGIKKLKFARISGDDHDLPWQYTVERYPTIVFFPAYRKEDSVEFPSTLPITTTNLLHFVLANAQPQVRWVSALKMCDYNCVTHNLAKSSQEVRKLFRNYHILTVQLPLTWKMMKEKYQEKFKTTNMQEHFGFAILFSKRDVGYIQQLVTFIRKIRSKINQAYYLLDILREKREQHIKELNKPVIVQPNQQTGNARTPNPIQEDYSESNDKNLAKDEL